MDPMAKPYPQWGFANERARAFPPMVVIDVTNVCNLACIHCAHPVIKAMPSYRAKFMEWDVWTRVIDEIARHKVEAMRVTGDGEPLLHPRLVEMLAYGKAKGVGPIDLTTNGKSLTRSLAVDLLKTGVDAVDVSLDAATKARYEAIRVHGDFDRLLANVEMLVDVRRELGAATKIMVSLVDQAEAREEVEAFVRHWGPRVDKVLVRYEHQNLGIVAKGAHAVPNLPPRWACPQFWKRVTISHEGKILFCVIDWLGKSALGDVRTQTIEEVWKSAPYEEMRRLHREGRENEHPLCGPCTDWATMPWGYGFDRVMSELFAHPAASPSA